MKKKQYLGIEFIEISEKQKKEILDANLEAKATSVKEFSEYYYMLSNGKVLYVVEHVFNYLFSNFEDYRKYMNLIEQAAKPGEYMESYSYPIKDSNFLSKIGEYIAFFVGIHGVNVDFKNLNDLKTVDTLLNELDVSEIKKYRLSLIALIGEFIVSNCSNAKWKYAGRNEQDLAPAIVIDNNKLSSLIDPATIIYNEYNKKVKNTNHRINLYKYTSDLLSNNCN